MQSPSTCVTIGGSVNDLAGDVAAFGVFLGFAFEGHAYGVAEELEVFAAGEPGGEAAGFVGPGFAEGYGLESGELWDGHDGV